jgi:BclB C-terminal domain-containing protein
VIPFASGAPAVLTGLVGNIVGTTTLVGFGSSFPGVSLTGGNISLVGGAGVATNYAFVVPRDGTITSISAFFSVVVGLSLLDTPDVTAQIYASTDPDSNTFAPVPGALVTMTLPAVTVLGTTVSGTTSGLSIPVTEGTRLLMVFSGTSTLVITLTGYASAGLGLS